MDDKHFSSTIFKARQRVFLGRNWIVGWMVFTLVFFPGFPGGNVISFPFSNFLQAGGDGYDGWYGEGEAGVSEVIESEYDYYTQDSDGDGFSDESESLAGTDPYDENSYPEAVDPAEVDTDGDGLTDAEEESGFEINHEVWVEDSTGYYNVEEDSIGFWMQVIETVITDPKNPDTDADGLPDGWEVNSGFNPISRADGLADGDLDGLSVGQEYQLGTNWLDPDTDGDGLLDGDEVLLFESDPNDPNDPGPEIEAETESDSLPPSGGMDGSNSGSGGTGGAGGALEQESATSSAQGSEGLPVTDSGSGGEQEPELQLPPDSANNIPKDSKYTYEVKGVILHFDWSTVIEKGQSQAPTQGGRFEIVNEKDEIVDVIEGAPETFEPLEEDLGGVVTPEMGGVDFYDGSNYQPFDSYESAYEEYFSRRQGLPRGTSAALPLENGFGTWVEWDKANVLEVWAAAFKSEEDVVIAGFAGGLVVRVKVAKASKQDEEKAFLLVKRKRRAGWYDAGGSQPITEYPWVVMGAEMLKLKIRAGETISERGAMLIADVEEGYINKTTLLPVEMVPDYNRDGKINDEDRGRVTKDEPWRWWVNDDDDSGEYGASGDLPDVPEAAALSQRDFQDNKVDGIRDLVDFFPLHLDLKQVLIEFPSSEYQYFLRQDNVVRRNSLGVFWYPWASLDRAPDEQYSVGGFLRNLDQAKDIVSREGETITKDGIRIPDDMLDAAGKGKGMLLLEGKFITFKPLMVEIRKLDGTKLVEIKFPIKIAKVEEMYRHVDLRTVPVNPDGSDAGNVPSNLATKTNDPGYPYPDRLTNGKYFVLVHGFNVNEEKARGWFAEIFKRLHQLGSKARFVGVSWRGDAGLGGVDLSPDNFIGVEKNANYHKPVFFAMQTGDKLKDALKFTGNADVTIAAHSLGNMVVSHAIAKAEFSPNRYYMIDAAVAAEAYNSKSVPNSERYSMLEKDWKPYLGIHDGSLKATSARWYELFEGEREDSRADLKWVDRFKVIKEISDVYHFYSTGEEVLQNTVNGMDSAAVFENGVPGAVDSSKGRRSWVAQEFVKGTYYLAGATQDFEGVPNLGTRQAGWGFDEKYEKKRIKLVPILGAWVPVRYRVNVPPKPSVVVNFSEDKLRYEPIFRKFLVEDLTDPILGDALASKKLVKYHALASGIPALSFAAGSNPIEGFRGQYDMQKQFKTNSDRWPTVGHEGKQSSGNWLHSDFYGVSLSHVYKMYEKMIELGKLNDENEG